jgi:hypothetical protein
LTHRRQGDCHRTFPPPPSIAAAENQSSQEKKAKEKDWNMVWVEASRPHPTSNGRTLGGNSKRFVTTEHPFIDRRVLASSLRERVLHPHIPQYRQASTCAACPESHCYDHPNAAAKFEMRNYGSPNARTHYQPKIKIFMLNLR